MKENSRGGEDKRLGRHQISDRWLAEESGGAGSGNILSINVYP
jgi:hypothetical protein